MRLVIATCQVDYEGRLHAHLPMARRLLLVKADGSLSIHSDDRAYKPLNWMNPPCTLREAPDRWTVTNPKGERLVIDIDEIHADIVHDLGAEPGLQKDGVEAHLQEMLAAHPVTLGDGVSLIRREHATDIGPVDLLCRDGNGWIAVEIKRVGEIDAVDQLTRYLERLALDATLRPLRGVLAAQTIKPQAKALAAARGITCIEVDYDELSGRQRDDFRLF